MSRLMIVLFVTIPILFLSLSLSLPSSFADTEFEDSVPLEVVKAFLGNGPYGETKIYSDRAEGFPDISLPSEFEIIGSLDSGYSIAIALRTDLSETETKALLADSVLEAAYIEIESMEVLDRQTGFVRPQQRSPLAFSRYCHDDMGSISFRYQEYGTSAVATVSSRPGNNGQNCAAQVAQQKQMSEQSLLSKGGPQQFVPRLELPESNRQGFSAFGSPGMRSSGGNFESETSISIDWKLEEVFEHFKTQIQEQNWVVDSENIGVASATGSWTLNPETNTNLVGTLLVLKTGDESYNLKFQMNFIGGSRSNSAFGVFSN